MKFSQMVMQAASYTKSSLLQLPHILPEHLRHFASKKVRTWTPTYHCVVLCCVVLCCVALRCVALCCVDPDVT